MSECCEKLKPYASLFLRIGLGVIFIYHGYGKVFGAGAGLGTSWNPSLPTVIQILVAWGELIGGLAILLGFLTGPACAGIVIIMLGAILTVHGKNGFSLMRHGFEYNFALIMMAIALMASGPGPLTLGCKCCSKADDSAKQEE